MPTRQARSHLDLLIQAAIRAGNPGEALSKSWHRVAPFFSRDPVYMLAVGKASVEMAITAAELLEEGLVDGLVVAVPDAAHRLHKPNIRVLDADHPLPTTRNVDAARASLGFVSSVPANATLLVLVSGGGSAHLTLPVAGITLDDIRTITAALQNAGTTIEQLNTVRKHCELLKGGRLAASCHAHRIVSLVLSDVQDDRLDVISSGPTAPDPSTFADALAVIERHRLLDVAPGITRHLRQGLAGEHPETPKPGDPSLARVHHFVIANNLTAKDAVSDAARRLGYFVARDHRFISGGASVEGRRLGATLRRLALSQQRTCFVAGGEPVVNVGSATGWGGPSQELALAAALELDDTQGALLACVSTDGVDGPPPPSGSPHAGACVSGETAQLSREAGHDPAAALAAHDSGSFFSHATPTSHAIITGPTGTNINHVVIGLLVSDRR